LYLAGGWAATLGHWIWNYLSHPNPTYIEKLYLERGSLIGASGAIMAIAVVFAGLFPHTSVYLYGILPVPAWAAVGGFIAWDIFSVNRNTGVAHAGHLGGAIYGLAYLMTLKRGKNIFKIK